MNTYILYEEYEGSNAKIVGIFDDEVKLKNAIEELSEDILKDILAVEPEESGICWDDMTEREKENLRQECRDMLKYSVLLSEYNVVQKESK